MAATGRRDDARKAALWYKEVYGDFYLEIQRHPISRSFLHVDLIEIYYMSVGRGVNLLLNATPGQARRSPRGADEAIAGVWGRNPRALRQTTVLDQRRRDRSRG
jgi:DNA polymerase III alpha subunit